MTLTLKTSAQDVQCIIMAPIMTRLERKSTPDEIRTRFNKEVERFSNQETGRQAAIDAPLVLELAAPASGSRVPELPKSVYRQLVVKPCRVFYRREGGRAFIVFVIRGERLFRKEFLK